MAMTTAAVSLEAQARIVRRLGALEQHYGMRLLYACESGSRIWGFPSRNSDYDIRGIYMYPQDMYLRLDDPPETIALIEDDLDIHFWDIYKFMTLAQRSNPSTLEWMTSPQVYIQPPALLRNHWNFVHEQHWWATNRLMHHYLGLARGEWKKYILERDAVKTKAYFYIVRPLLLLEWLTRHDTLPPTQDLLLLMTMLTYDAEDHARLTPEVRGAIARLALEKRKGREFDAHQRVPLLDEFIACELEYWDATRATWDVKKPLPLIYGGHANFTVLELHQQYRTIFRLQDTSLE